MCFTQPVSIQTRAGEGGWQKALVQAGLAVAVRRCCDGLAHRGVDQELATELRYGRAGRGVRRGGGAAGGGLDAGGRNVGGGRGARRGDCPGRKPPC